MTATLGCDSESHVAPGQHLCWLAEGSTLIAGEPSDTLGGEPSGADCYQTSSQSSGIKTKPKNKYSIVMICNLYLGNIKPSADLGSFLQVRGT